jgi:hypothetical protein
MIADGSRRFAQMFLADVRRWFSQIGADYFSRRLAQIIFLADVRGFLSQMFADFSRRCSRMFLADFRGFFLADWR